MGTRVDTENASRGLSECLKGVKNMSNVFYFKKINVVGGVESYFYYLSKKYDFKVYYKEASAEQVKRLAQNIEIRKYKEPIKCDKFFCNYGLDIDVEAKEKYHIVHCDYKNVWFAPIQYEGFKYIGVSQLSCDSFKELTGKDCELIYNPIYIDKPNVSKYNDNKIHLISATRLTREKGLNRMQKLSQMLDKAGIDYEWVVYTNKYREKIGKNVIFKEPKLDIIEEIAKADFLVQLSDCEAYCYSVIEALSVGTKVICTDLPVFKELGVNDNNAIICDLNMSNVNIEKIKKYEPFTYTPPKDNWGKYLTTKKTYDPNELVEVKVLKRYCDVVLGKSFLRGSIAKMTKARASELEAKGLAEW